MIPYKAKPCKFPMKWKNPFLRAYRNVIIRIVAEQYK